ncbi:hypothetical protein Smp_196260 [Schistosoma mansoni]|uniref:hypothetical protein n=1 Tax=Schistosoma mansoni TaxID=6183 RepID=UPI00022DC69F|nr:hypothetical protein Smp_196260 [Schistosoma mansoni]|eukprot:XP_018649120.1 hypothetical protein Smp_196260 [Schistosoma mansoni]
MRSAMNKLQQLMDENVEAIRLMPTTFLVIGVYLLGRHFYIFTKFNSIYSIPSGVYSRQIHLKGLVKSINSTGELEVFHVPKVKLPFQVSYGNAIKICIPVQHSGQSIQWLQQNIHPGERVVFIPVKPIFEDSELLAIIYKRCCVFKKDISYHLLVNGIANHKSFNDLPYNFRNKYSSAIAKAIRMKRGIWQEDYKVWKFCKFFQKIKRLVNL